MFSSSLDTSKKNDSWNSNFQDRDNRLFQDSIGNEHSQNSDLQNVQQKPAYLNSYQLQATEEEENIQAKAIQRSEASEEEEMQMKAVQRAGDEEEELQMKKSDSGKSLQEAGSGNESSLPQNFQNGIMSMTGMDTSDVKVHYNSEQPAQLQAHAFTQGNDIHVGKGQEKHLGHEAWHVVQQRQGRVTPTTSLKGIGVNDNSSLEHEADVMGSKISSANNSTTQMKQEVSNAPYNLGKVQQFSKKGGKKPKEEFVPKHDASAFSPKKAKKIQKSMIEAYNMTSRAKQNISKDNKKYKTWMDKGTVDTANQENRLSHVKKGFEKIEKCLKEDEVKLKEYALNDGEKSSTYAYVTNEKAKNIYLGGAFWSIFTSVKGTNSKAGTIIHELTHKLHGTDDHVYGTSGAKKLAKTDPGKATTNADNYEYFAEKS